MRGRHLKLMPRTGIPDWRDGRVYEQLHGIDRHGLMWEWLRRDAAYVAWQVRASTATGGTGAAAPMDPRQWGLHFRRRPGAAGPGGSDHLACQPRSWSDCSERGGGGGIGSRRGRRHRPIALALGRGGRGGRRAYRPFGRVAAYPTRHRARSEEHTSELQSLMRTS